jgi:hypothetical protein
VQKSLSALIIARTVQLSTMLAEAGDTPENPVPVVGETGRGLLVSALRATGRVAYRSNRSQRPVSQPPPGLGTNVRRVNAVLLANILRTDAAAHRPLPADTAWGKRPAGRRVVPPATDN